MRATFRYVLLTAFRDRFVAAIVLTLLAAVGVSGLLAASTVVEGRQAGLAYGGELCRTALVLGLVTFVCFHVRRLHDSREIEAMLARPLSRGAFIFAYYGAFCAVALPLALAAGALLMAGLGGRGAGLALWEASLMLEVLIVLAMALFAAMALESATAAVLAALGFYALGRSMAMFVGIVKAGSGATDSAGVNVTADVAVRVVAAVMPRLDLFGQSRWLTLGPGGGWGLRELLLQTAIYVPLLLLATVRDLGVKRF